MAAFRIVLLAIGVAACSTAGLFIKASHTPPILIAAWRLLLASTVLLPVFLIALRRHPHLPVVGLLRTALPAAVLLSLHFWTWNAGIHATTIANATLIVNMVAPVMPLAVWLLLKERAQRREVLGTVVAFVGTVLLSATSLSLDWSRFTGDLLCFASMLALTVYLVWSRRSRALPSLWLYVPPVYFLSGILCLGAGWLQTGSPWVAGTGEAATREWLLMLALAAIPTLIGHSILNYSMQVLASQLVAVCNLAQFVPATVLAWVLFNELPGWEFPVATALVLGGAVLVLRAHRPGAGAAKAPDTEVDAGPDEY